MEKQQENSLSLDVKFKFKDVLRYNTSVAIKNIVNDIVLGIGLAVLIFFFYKMCTTTERLDIFISKNITLLLVPILIFVLIPWRVWQVTASQMQMPAFAYGVKYVFSEKHILLDIGEASEEMSWDLFVNIVETKYDFRFYVNKVSAQIIPKHNLTDDQLSILRTMIKTATKPGICRLK
ncbi:YcxB family protein [Cellulosilyticum sp. ST5]|uniref:YcxB family protein n=1 Tax=unclassified Cellulosilyticum TaxID=2643091 RepID=UPI000F8C4E43|nr:YcxB family protein [Cellulosilyticum sp. WCF-2]QEH68838.1 YcxB family protein [Cellulosilyticum sp. WCF-2]